MQAPRLLIYFNTIIFTSFVLLIDGLVTIIIICLVFSSSLLIWVSFLSTRINFIRLLFWLFNMIVIRFSRIYLSPLLYRRIDSHIIPFNHFNWLLFFHNLYSSISSLFLFLFILGSLFLFMFVLIWLLLSWRLRQLFYM